MDQIKKLQLKKQKLLNEVEPLVKLKKKLYSNIDISEAKSQEEKNLEKKISNIYSEINDIVIEIRKLNKKNIGSMTSKQRQAQANFKKVVKEASALRKKNPHLTQAQAVKQAWAINYSKKKVNAVTGVKKKKTTLAKTTKDAIKRTLKKAHVILPHGYGIKKGEVRNIGGKPKEFHKDTKSHNVNIRVMSGMQHHKIGAMNAKSVLPKFAKESRLNADVVKLLKDKVHDYNMDWETLMRDILHYGLQSGLISQLIYYRDTTKFYQKHRKDIANLLSETLQNYGSGATPEDIFGGNWDKDDPLAFDDANQNLLAWFAFEETTRNLSYRLGYDM